MYKATFEFKSKEDRDEFLAYMCDGGGEYPWMESKHVDDGKMVSFDYEDDWGKEAVTVPVAIKELVEQEL